MKNYKWMVTLLAVLMTGSIYAANWDWDGGGGADTSWTNVLNWKNDLYYGALDIPLFRNGDFATVESGVVFSLPSSTMRLGQNDGSGTGQAEVLVNGGDLTILNKVIIGFDAGGTGLLTISNGVFRANSVEVCNGAGVGAINMYGGLMAIAGDLRLSGDAGANVSTLGLYGGTLTADSLTFGNTVDVDITDGLMIIAGDEASDIQALVDNGMISADGSGGGADVSGYTFSGGLNASGDLRWGVEDGGDTVVYAIPEPATLGLITAFGSGMLFIRRYFIM